MSKHLDELLALEEKFRPTGFYERHPEIAEVVKQMIEFAKKMDEIENEVADLRKPEHP